jgi:hypothetical protein
MGIGFDMTPIRDNRYLRNAGHSDVIIDVFGPSSHIPYVQSCPEWESIAIAADRREEEPSLEVEEKGDACPVHLGAMRKQGATAARRERVHVRDKSSII